MSFLEDASVVQRVRGVVQIVNDGPVPMIPRNYSELRDWYSEVRSTHLTCASQLSTFSTVELSGSCANRTD